MVVNTTDKTVADRDLVCGLTGDVDIATDQLLKDSEDSIKALDPRSDDKITEDSIEEGELIEEIVSQPITTLEFIQETLTTMEADNQGNVVSFTNPNLEVVPRLKRKHVEELTKSIIDEITTSMAPDDLDFQFKQEKKHYLDDLDVNVLETIEDFLIGVGKSEKWGRNCAAPEAGAISAKLQALVDTLSEFDGNAQFCGIVFCQMKSVTIAIQHLINVHPRLQFLRSAYLIGHDSTSKKNSGMAAQMQASLVKRFLAGEINLLVSTSIGEEGLDIKPCNCVIQFDFESKTVTSYIQSRGRARHLTSQYIILAQAGDQSVKKLLDSN
jgi:ERCC4-related helicase